MNHALAVVLALSSSASALAAPSTVAAVAAPPAPHSVYRFDITITGADPAPATYTMILEENQGGSVSTGTNIPLTVGANGANGPAREDVGLSIHMAYSLRGGVVLLAGGVEMSSAAPATSNGAATIHRVRADSVVPITPGTPALFSSAYDITSKHRYEVNVSAQRLL